MSLIILPSDIAFEGSHYYASSLQGGETTGSPEGTLYPVWRFLKFTKETNQRLQEVPETGQIY